VSKSMPEPFEIDRAQARPDFEAMTEAISAWQGSFRQESSKRALSDWTDPSYDFEELYLSGQVDPERALACVSIALHNHDDPEFLFFVAAGPLEDILRDPTQEILERVRLEARRTARFRWMLTGVWTHGLRPDVAEQLKIAVAGMTENDPLPAI